MGVSTAAEAGRAERGAANPIDAFLGARLAALGLEPAPPADRRTLIRRATFDLTGLPPTPDEIDAFVADPDPDGRAFEKVIDRLLASPHYGEQAARHWLDVTRYADSSGFANDYERGNAWRYRDYVVRSFNADKPYDRFVREQIAGDEIDPADPELLVAVGFLRAGAWELTGMEVREGRPAAVPRRRDRRRRAGVPRPHAPVRPLPRPQVRPGPDAGLLPHPGGVRHHPVDRAAGAVPEAENTTGFGERKYLDARRARFESELKRIRAAESAARTKWEAANPDKKGQKPPRHEFLSPADLGMERIARKGLERLQVGVRPVRAGRPVGVRRPHAEREIDSHPVPPPEEPGRGRAGGVARPRRRRPVQPEGAR